MYAYGKGDYGRVVSDLETHTTLLAATWSEADFAHLMQEDVEIAKKRADISEKVKVLRATGDIVDNVSLPRSRIPYHRVIKIRCKQYEVDDLSLYLASDLHY